MVGGRTRIALSRVVVGPAVHSTTSDSPASDECQLSREPARPLWPRADRLAQALLDLFCQRWLQTLRNGARMTTRRIVGSVLLVIGLVALVWGGVFWTDRETIVDAGPFEVTTEEREGVRVPPVLGAIAVIGGIVLLVAPDRRRASS